MVAVDQIKEFLAAAKPLEMAELAQDKAATDERWKVTMKIGSAVVYNSCVLYIDFISLTNCSLMSLGSLGTLLCTFRRSSCRLLPN